MNFEITMPIKFIITEEMLNDWADDMIIDFYDFKDDDCHDKEIINEWFSTCFVFDETGSIEIEVNKFPNYEEIFYRFYKIIIEKIDKQY